MKKRASRRLLRQLQQEGCPKPAADWPDDNLAEHMAHCRCERIALHPFYGRNGRITRLFFERIAKEVGYEAGRP